MTGRFDLLTQELFQKNISDCSWEEIRELASQYPYFAPAQYILAKKSKLENAGGKNAGDAGKAILYYHNPMAFDLLMHPEKYETDLFLDERQIIEKIDESHPKEIAVEQSRSVSLPVEPGPINAAGTVTTATQQAPDEAEAAEHAITPAPFLPGESFNESLVFEPFHTVDYFASQGIKLSQEAATKDQMGKQLKSFTEWLKTMRRDPVVEQDKKTDPVVEKKVATLAAHSIESTSIITEAMAEVWAMQGNREKAIEIYNKLSSLHPSKKAHYAAKIEKLTKRPGNES